MSIHQVILLIFAVSLGVGCNKPDPKPELKDEIYQDMLRELKSSEQNIARAQSELETHRKALSEVKPQTGQIKYAQKRVFDAERAIDQFKQQQKYWVIRSESRRDFVRKKSLEAFQKGETWVVEGELEAHLAEKRLRNARRQWDARQRREDFLNEEALLKKKAGAAQPEGD